MKTMPCTFFLRRTCTITDYSQLVINLDGSSQNQLFMCKSKGSKHDFVIVFEICNGFATVDDKEPSKKL